MKIEVSLEEARKIYKLGCVDIRKLLLGLTTFTESQLEEKELPKSWIELMESGCSGGYYVTNNSEIDEINNHYIDNRGWTEEEKNIFVYFKQAESSLAMSQLSQLMKVYNDGWEPNWNNRNVKYVIVADSNKLRIGVSFVIHYFLAFETQEIAKKFLENFGDLIKEYYMIKE